MRSSKKAKALYIIYILCCYIFFYLPIVVTMVFSFNSSKSLTHLTGFSLRWYERLINDGSIVKAVYVSLTIAVFATFISTAELKTPLPSTNSIFVIVHSTADKSIVSSP